MISIPTKISQLFKPFNSVNRMFGIITYYLCKTTLTVTSQGTLSYILRATANKLLSTHTLPRVLKLSNGKKSNRHYYSSTWRLYERP